MGHVQRGPATDQFDGLGALIRWVEYGDAPDRIVASARGVGNPGGVNTDLPASWAADRTRPLCPYPKVATYRGGNPGAGQQLRLPSQPTRIARITPVSARLDRQDMVEDLVGIPSALRFLELLVVPAVVQLGPWDA